MRLRTMHKRRKRKQRKVAAARTSQPWHGYLLVSSGLASCISSALDERRNRPLRYPPKQTLDASVTVEMDCTPEQLEACLSPDPYGPLSEEYLS